MTRPTVKRSFAIAALLAGSLWAGTSARADYVDVNLAFSSLPSAQGWTYSEFHSAYSETQAWSVDGAGLHMNTLGQSFQGQGDNFYYMPISDPAPGSNFQVNATVSVPQFQTSYSDPTFNPYGFGITLYGDTPGYAMGLTDEVQVTGPTQRTGDVNVSFNTSGWHSYSFFGSPSANTYSLSIDNAVVSSGTLSSMGSPIFGQITGIGFGDYTGGENAMANISALSVVETPEPASLSLLAVGGIAMLRRNRRKV